MRPSRRQGRRRSRSAAPEPRRRRPLRPRPSRPPSRSPSRSIPAVPAPRRFTPVARPEIPKPQPKPEPRQEQRRQRRPRRPPQPRLRRHPARRRRAKRPEPPARPSRGAAVTGDDRRQSGKLTVNRALGDDDGARARSLAALKRAREKEHRRMGGPREPQAKQVRDVVVPEAITVQELANRMAEKGADLVKALFKMGMPVTMTQTIDQDTAELLVTEFGHNIVRVSDSMSICRTDTSSTMPRRSSRVRRSSRSWAMSITARPRCSTRCAAPMWCAARPAASPSISAPIRSR